jgi:hypothetical protein
MHPPNVNDYYHKMKQMSDDLCDLGGYMEDHTLVRNVL